MFAIDVETYEIKIRIMKNYRIIIISVFAFIMAFSSCKKGEDDPFLSFRSRDSRITGEWLISNISGTERNHTKYISGSFEGNSTTEVITHEFGEYIWTKNTTVTTVVDDETETTTDETTTYFNERITINKDGIVTFKRTYESGNEVVSSGYWYWVDSNKKKIGITFIVDYENITFNIRQLKNNELVLETKKTDYSSTSTTVSDSEIEVFHTYEKQ
jgi:hypothetical protein